MRIGKLRDCRGSASVEFLFTSAMLILVFSVLVTALVYVTQFYSASYICRRVVRTIEIAGEYNAAEIRDLADDLGGTALDNLTLTVDAPYWSGRKIQLRDEFTVHLKADYPVHVLLFQGGEVALDLPIEIDLSGRSEVYWKS